MKKILYIITLLSCTLLSTSTFAQSTPINEYTAVQKEQAFAQKAGLGDSVDIAVIIKYSIETLLGALGIIFLILIIYSGFQWMTSGGNDDKVKDAKTRMKNATIGLVVVLMSYSIMTFVKLIIYAAQ